MSDNATKQTLLMEMGFGSQQAIEALTVCQGNVERAIEYLFSSPSPDPPSSVAAATTPSAGAKPQDVVASISQYSLDQGRSACTCIALTAAHSFLLHPDVSNVTPLFIQEAITQGVSVYQKLQQSPSASVEHMSAEEVLALAGTSSSSSSQVAPFSHLQLTAGGIRQGILSKLPNPDMGMHAMLTACRKDAPPDKWLAVLITKTPETVLACVPPTSSNNPSSSSSLSNSQFVVIDSHPRPGVVNSNGGAYARVVPSLHDLVAHLETILPATELGPDIPEMMAIMYNSFDLYPLILK